MILLFIGEQMKVVLTKDIADAVFCCGFDMYSFKNGYYPDFLFPFLGKEFTFKVEYNMAKYYYKDKEIVRGSYLVVLKGKLKNITKQEYQKKYTRIL